MHVAVGEPLGAHIVKMVGCLQASPGAQQIFVAAGLHLFFQTVDSRDGILLHVIAQPGGQVAFGVGPGHEIVHVETGHGLEHGRRFGGRHETEARQGKQDVRQGLHELEDARGFPLVFAKGLVVHEQVDDVPCGPGGLGPAGEFFRRQRDGLPASRYDVLLPSEVGFSLPKENLNSDVHMG